MQPKFTRRLSQAGSRIDDLIARLEAIQHDLVFDDGVEEIGDILDHLQDARYAINDLLPEPA